MSPRTAGVQPYHPILCGKCGLEIEHCQGVHGEWMHTKTRRESCTRGGYAEPEAPSADYKERVS